MEKEVLEFLGSIPLFQQLPYSSIEEIANVVESKQLEQFKILAMNPADENDLYIVRIGELTRRGFPLKVLMHGDHGTGRELQGAVATTKVSFLVLKSKFSNLITTTAIWNKSLPLDETSLCEKILQLEKIGIDVFRGDTLPSVVSFNQMYGGQLVAQALVAASKSVSPFMLARSLHSLFLLAGDITTPVTYQVQRIQDSRSLATRMVIATQRNRIIFTLSASFQREEDGIEHQIPMPDAPKTDEVLPEEAVFQQVIQDPRISQSTRELIIERSLSKERPLDFRSCDPIDLVEPEPCEAKARVWVRAKGRLSDDQALHRCVAAYASDWFFLECAFRPHALTKGPDALFLSDITILSLDHSVWFHKLIKADEWLLFAMDSPRASGGRALVTGHMYNQQGEMVATVTQQGMIRVRTKSKL